jgi:hypothetical protein
MKGGEVLRREQTRRVALAADYPHRMDERAPVRIFTGAEGRLMPQRADCNMRHQQANRILGGPDG